MGKFPAPTYGGEQQDYRAGVLRKRHHVIYILCVWWQGLRLSTANIKANPNTNQEDSQGAGSHSPTEPA